MTNRNKGMDVNKLKTCLSAAILASSYASTAHAAQPPVNYIGASVGQAIADDFCLGGETRCDDAALSLRIHGGGRINDILSFETGYRFVDDMEAEGSFIYQGAIIDAAFAMNGHFLDATLQLGVPANEPVKIHAKLGAVYWRFNYEVEASSGFFSMREEDSDTGVAVRTGLALTYQASDTMRLRADWDLMLGVGDDDSTGETDVNVFSVGPEFLF